MRYLSVFSGIEAATAAWHDWGWECVGVSEIDAFPCEVLKQRYPHIPNLGDITKITEERLNELGSVDIVVGGSPCQSFSTAGKRDGLADDRGKLMLEYIRVVGTVRPKWFIWENVPGVLSSDKGRAFGTLLRQMADIGYNLCWRVLDAQHFGVPQRRRRVFLVGHLGTDRECAAKVLFDPYCLGRDFKTSTEKRKDYSTEAAACLGIDSQQIAYNSVNENVDKLQLSRLNHHIINGRQDPITSSVAQPLTTDTSGLDNVFCDVYNGSISDVAPTMTTATGITNGSGPKLLQATHYNIRRLTPVECERLQGFSDNHTRIEWRGKSESDCPDGHRYKALGNSMAVPVMRWIGHNINRYDERKYLPW
jgi:DNA (cytosine-5)-methyltransferase 1